MRIKRLEHVALAVESIPAFREMLERVFGLTANHVEDFQDHQTGIAMVPIGESALELVEGWTEETGARRWIAERGQSLYHLCLEVEDLDGTMAELRARNVTFLYDTPIRGHSNARITFIDPACTGHILFELAELPANPH